MDKEVARPGDDFRTFGVESDPGRHSQIFGYPVFEPPAKTGLPKDEGAQKLTTDLAR